MYDIDKSLFWIGHASFYLKCGDYTLFIDPFGISAEVSRTKADLILVTHAHFDHFSKKDMGSVSKKDTEIITSTQTLEEKKGIRIARPGYNEYFHGVKIEAVPAYNVNRERLGFHPKANQWVGYVIETDGTRIYHSGDTDLIPEMGNMADIDYALLPMGGTYTMDVDETIKAAEVIGAKTVIPMHYKNLLGVEGSRKAEEKLKSKLKNVRVLKEVQEPTYSFK